MVKWLVLKRSVVSGEVVCEEVVTGQAIKCFMGKWWADKQEIFNLDVGGGGLEAEGHYQSTWAGFVIGIHPVMLTAV